MDKGAAQRAARHGAIAAFVAAALTLALVSYAIVTDARGSLGIWNDPSNFVDVALVVACGIGLLRNSRAAAVVLLVYFVFSRVLIGVELGRASGLWLALVLAFFFARAAAGTFVYHRMRRREDPAYRAAPRWTYWAGIPPGALALLVLSFGLLQTLNVVPGTAVLTGKQLPKSDVSLLRAKGVLLPGEEVRLFYSAGLLSVLEDGNLLTDQRVVSYEQRDGELNVYAAPFADVTDVRLVEKGGTFSPTVIEVHTEDGGFRLLLSTENGGDERFIDALERETPAPPSI